MRILLDMDEVLVNFVDGALAAWGVERAPVLEHWTPGRWDMVPPLSKALGLAEPMSNNRFWSRLEGDSFWLGLEPLPWFDDLLQLITNYTDDWHIVTSPSLCPTSYDGKVKWLKTKFGKSFDRFAITPHKYLFAGPDTVLIDDRDRNIEEFAGAGGIGVVFPSHHNSEHRVANGADWLMRIPAPLEYVNRRLDKIAHRLKQEAPLPPVPIQTFRICNECATYPCECPRWKSGYALGNKE